MNNVALTDQQRARRIIDEAGQAGGSEEVRRLAEFGWPENRELEHDSPNLREWIKRTAVLEYEAMTDTSGT